MKTWAQERLMDAQDLFMKRPAIDWVLAVTVGVVLWVLSWRHVLGFNPRVLGVDPLLHAGPDARRAAYSAFAIVVGILGAFTTATTTSYVSSTGERQDHLRRIFGEDIRRSLRRGITAAIAVIAMLIMGIIVDNRGVGWYGWRFTLIPAVLLGLMRFGRVALLFTMLIDLKDADARDPITTAKVEPYRRVGAG